MASWANSVNGATVPIAGSLLVDARASQSGCSGVSLQGMTINLSGDLTIVADGFQGTNGLTVNSADSSPHVLRILVPGATQSCNSSQQIVLNGGTVFGNGITGRLHSPGTVSIDGTSNVTGQIEAGCLNTSGALTFHTADVPTPGLN